MSETLVGVIVGGAVGVASALITAVVGPLLAARHERRKARAERVHAVLAELPETRAVWWGGTFAAASGHDSGITSEQVENLTRLLSRLATSANDAALRRATTKASGSVSTAWTMASVAEVARLRGMKASDDALDNIGIKSYEAAADLDAVTAAAMEIVDPTPWWLRLYRLAFPPEEPKVDYAATMRELRKVARAAGAVGLTDKASSSTTTAD
ncbi:hypothetical protein [Isoptericola dokdonensis]|uniref:Uncharacterized protein n=1 Tax=Isoptericola dokdonensis DS-3 TaxID=1300344 RepID=A0A161I7B5_9MICO|nr:hypothetical protein [Isoptericola dokdonensis]ANC31448.1 hypothetical protein I598_1900 [Isoptericola dokdonensis DS-3]